MPSSAAARVLRAAFSPIVFGSLLLLAPVRLAAQITLSAELNTPSNSYSYEPGGAGYNGSTAYLSASVLPSFTFAFSSAGDTELTVTWSAPTGQLIAIDAPDGWGNVGIQIQYRGGTRTGDAYFETYSVQGLMNFTDLTGSFSSAGHTNIIFATTDRYEVISYLNVASGDRVTFSSVSVTYTLPESLNYDYTSVVANSIAVIGNVSKSGIEAGSPGNWISLQSAPGPSVPEPSTYALLFGIGALGFAAWRRRR